MLFASRTDDELLGYGVPAEWLGDVKRATETTPVSYTHLTPPTSDLVEISVVAGLLKKKKSKKKKKKTASRNNNID